MGRRTLLWMPWILTLGLLALFAAWLREARQDSLVAEGRVKIGALLSTEDVAGYQRALEPREFSFPADHAPHAGFRTEWWYFTGNLEDREGRRFGYQLTFFRSALTPKPLERDSRFAADHAWMAHFTLSDVADKKFHSFERFSREAVGLAGAQTKETAQSIWLRDWRMQFDAASNAFVLSAREQGLAIELTLQPSKPAVLHGENGLSRKNATQGNASYYYSLTRLETAGSIEREGEAIAVTGSSWMDREWMTSALSQDQLGWDWLALQLDDGSEWMWYQLRRVDGSLDPYSAGTFVERDGARHALDLSAVSVKPSGSWTSPRSKADYPTAWDVSVPSLELELRIQPLLADQELDVSFRYWEGAVEARGTRAGKPVSARGYVEMVGYGDKPAPGAQTAR